MGSFSGAARKLGKSQSTISESISRLEIDLDRRYPELEFECIVAEHGDVISLITNRRADSGLYVTCGPPAAKLPLSIGNHCRNGAVYA